MIPETYPVLAWGAIAVQIDPDSLQLHKVSDRQRGGLRSIILMPQQISDAAALAMAWGAGEVSPCLPLSIP